MTAFFKNTPGGQLTNALGIHTQSGLLGVDGMMMMMKALGGGGQQDAAAPMPQTPQVMNAGGGMAPQQAQRGPVDYGWQQALMKSLGQQRG